MTHPGRLGISFSHSGLGYIGACEPSRAEVLLHNDRVKTWDVHFLQCARPKMSNSNSMREWNNYFRSLPSPGYGDITSQLHLQRLAAEETRLFGGEGEIETWQISSSGSGADSASPTDESLTQIWPSNEINFWCSQCHTWDGRQDAWLTRAWRRIVRLLRLILYSQWYRTSKLLSWPLKAL